jgi:hypothetical protein
MGVNLWLPPMASNKSTNVPCATQGRLDIETLDSKVLSGDTSYSVKAIRRGGW